MPAIGTEETILMMKYFISYHFGIPIKEQKLLYKGKIMTNNDLTMLQSGIEPNSTLLVSISDHYNVLIKCQNEDSVSAHQHCESNENNDDCCADKSNKNSTSSEAIENNLKIQNQRNRFKAELKRKIVQNVSKMTLEELDHLSKFL
ncbi:MAG: hypothetical protein MHMPM18_001454 [Marteilia pararefringens]